MNITSGNSEQLKDFLDGIAERMNNASFIPNDPISVPHQFHLKQDIEIAGFFTAILSWGNRKTIIQKSRDLMKLMDDAPYDYIKNHMEADRKRFLHFKHRTFQTEDVLYFLEFLQQHFNSSDSLETAFCREPALPYEQESALKTFHHYFFDSDTAPHRTKKHISTPLNKSACKRLNMFLRWMVRSDDKKVDFGIWKTIPPSALMIPLDVHVEHYARLFGLLTRKQRDWQAVVEITENLRKWNKEDPVIYDYALFGMGVNNKELQHYFG